MVSQHNVAAEPFESLEVCSAPLLRLDSQLQIAADDFDDAMIVVPAPVPCDVVCVTVPVGSSATHRGKRRIKELQQQIRRQARIIDTVKDDISFAHSQIDESRLHQYRQHWLPHTGLQMAIHYLFTHVFVFARFLLSYCLCKTN